MVNNGKISKQNIQQKKVRPLNTALWISRMSSEKSRSLKKSYGSSHHQTPTKKNRCSGATTALSCLS